MSFPVQQSYRFDAQGKLDADDWLLIPRVQLAPAFTLDDALAQKMTQLYLETVAQWGIVKTKVVQEANTICLRAPFGKTAMVFADAERLVDKKRAETSWQIAGGFLLAHRVNYGGRFYLGAEWAQDALKVYSAIRRFPPRLVATFGGRNGIALYNLTQGSAHTKIQTKYLARVAAEIISTKN